MHDPVGISRIWVLQNIMPKILYAPAVLKTIDTYTLHSLGHDALVVRLCSFL